MKFLLSFLLPALFCHAQMVVNPYAFASASGYVFQEDFEGTGIPANFPEYGGTQNRDYDFTTSPLQGAQSFLINSTTTSSPRGNSFDHAFGSAAFSVYFIWRRNDDPTAIAAIWQKLRAADGSTQNSLSVNNTAMTLVLRNGNSITGTGSYAVAANTAYHIWIDVAEITGDVQVFIDTTATKPASPALTQAGYNLDGTSTATGTLVFSSMRSMDSVFDKIRVKTDGIIGSNPS